MLRSVTNLDCYEIATTTSDREDSTTDIKGERIERGNKSKIPM